MSPTVYLISGANRGIGLGLVKSCLERPGAIVFAGARNPSEATALKELRVRFPQRLHIVKLVSSDKTGNEDAIKQVKEIAGRLDVVIANAGIANYVGKAIDTPADMMAEHYNVNVIGTLTLFQASYPLLTASTHTPKFIPVSSGAGGISDGALFPFGFLAYGASKAAENYLARRLHGEHPDLVCFALSPGAVDTDLGMSRLTIRYALHSNTGQFVAAKTIEMEPKVAELTGTPASVAEIAEQIIHLVENATREKNGGLFVKADGNFRAW